MIQPDEVAAERARLDALLDERLAMRPGWANYVSDDHLAELRERASTGLPAGVTQPLG